MSPVSRRVVLGPFELNLIPATTWFQSLARLLPWSEWRRIRERELKGAGFRCSICGAGEARQPLRPHATHFGGDLGGEDGLPGLPQKSPDFLGKLHCHEVWSFDHRRHLQRLEGFKVLCPRCHLCHHLYFARTMGRLEEAKNWMRQVTGEQPATVERACREALKVFSARSQRPWGIQLSFSVLS